MQLDIITLQQWGLLEHPVIIEMETKRLEKEERRKRIEEMLDKLEGLDSDLEDILVAVELANAKEEAKRYEKSA